MRKDIKTTNFDFTNAIKDYVNEKIDMLDKFVRADDESAYASVEISKRNYHHQKGNVFYAEINLHIAGKDLRAQTKDEDLYAAVDQVKDEMVRELTSHKGKKETLIRKGARKLKEIIQRPRRKRDFDKLID